MAGWTACRLAPPMCGSPRRALAVALLLVACSGSDNDGSALPAQVVGPETFAAALAEPDRVSLNVHVPDEGSIVGTDLRSRSTSSKLARASCPTPSTPVALYCRSGNMNATAARTPRSLTDVVHARRQVLSELDGGMLIDRKWPGWRRSLPLGASGSGPTRS